MGGTGVDTLYDVDAARFGSGSNEQWSLFKPEVKSLKEFNPNSGQEEVTGFKIRGTEYNDTVSASSYSTSNDQVIFFQPNGSTGGNDAFTGRTAGKDGLELSGLFSRYDISFNDSNDTWTITDKLPQNKGGDGTITATSIEKIQFGGPFSMKIGSAFAGQKGSDATTQISISREVQKADGGFHSYEFGKFSVLAGDGTLLTSVGADDDGIAENQTVGSATNLTLNGSLDTNNDDNISLADNYAGKFISITSAAGGNDSGITFTVTGTNWAGTEITDVITVLMQQEALLQFMVQRNLKQCLVASSGASAGNVKIGVANEMFMPAGYETTDHDGDNNNANGNTLITPAILYGAAQTNDAATLIAAIDGNSDGTVTQTEVETKRVADQSFFGGWEGGKNYHIQMESGGLIQIQVSLNMVDPTKSYSLNFGEGSDDKFFRC